MIKAHLHAPMLLEWVKFSHPKSQCLLNLIWLPFWPSLVLSFCHFSPHLRDTDFPSGMGLRWCSIPGPFYWAKTFSYLSSILLPVLDSIRNRGSFACTGSVLHLLNSVVMWLKHTENNHKWLGVAASPQNYACKCRGHMTCTCWPSAPCLWWHLLQPLEVSGLTYLPAVCPPR